MQKTIHSEPYRLLINWLITARHSKNISMRELAKVLHVSHTWIGKVEQAERRIDILEYLRLCEAIGIDPHEGLRLVNRTRHVRRSDHKNDYRVPQRRRPPSTNAS